LKKPKALAIMRGAVPMSDRDVRRAEHLVERNAQFLVEEWEKLHARR
jgi:hypothetical protein